MLLSANVFVGALRAIALGLASSEKLFVRASRRCSVLATALSCAAGDLFELVTELTPTAGEHLWAYGSDETMSELVGVLPPGVRLHAHGAGVGAAYVELESVSDIDELCRALAIDTALFDQRGCASLRLVLLSGEAGRDEFCDKLTESLIVAEASLPGGSLKEAELAAVAWYSKSLRSSGSWRGAGSGSVAVLDPDALVIPPVGRHIAVLPVVDVSRALRTMSDWLTTLAVAAPEAVRTSLNAEFPRLRMAAPGHMQRPALDGPLDRRVPLGGELVPSAKHS